MNEVFTVSIFLIGEKQPITLTAPAGENLRKLLLDHDLSPYTRFTQKLNCGGRGLCATCGIWLAEDNEVQPVHWHDRAAEKFGYPRLSCQIQVNRDLTIYMVEKWIWGARK
ncbi:MAG: 2Fe-2S iron-sulfur cluster-binding protein [Ardenticatenaceae bacterium]|nr:2Fe-2S iron-sulfur cluster-binding protein [Ardenticatenaceae bacterium]